MIEHISDAEWIDYLSAERMTPEVMNLYAKIHAHIGVCAECRALHDRITRVGTALNVLNFSTKPTVSAFRAVADDQPEEGNEEYGALSVEIYGGCFLPNTLLAEGDAEKYCFLCEEDATRLTDDCDDETYIAVEDGTLHLNFPGEVDLRLIAEWEGAQYELDAQGHAVLPMSNSEGTLRLTFSAPK